MKSKRKIRFYLLPLIALTLIYMPCNSFAQHVKIDSITVADGLSQGFVSSILQDSRGFMWFTTKDGLNRYDGKNFKYYKNDPLDTTSIVDDLPFSIVEDDAKRIWISTLNKNLDCFDPETEVFYHVSAFNFPKRPFGQLRLLRNSNGKIFIDEYREPKEILNHGNEDLGKIKIQKLDLNYPDEPNKYHDVHQVLQTTQEIYLYDKKKFYYSNVGESDFDIELLPTKVNNGQYFVFNSLDDTELNWIYFDGILKCLKNNQIVREYKLDTDISDLLPFVRPNYIHQDAFENLWIMSGAKFYKIEANQLQNEIVKVTTIIDSRVCYTLYKDNSNKLWIGTNGFGVKIIDPARPRIKNMFSDISPNWISAINDSIYQIGGWLVNMNGDYIKRNESMKILANNKGDYIVDAAENTLVINRGKDTIEFSNLNIKAPRPFLDQSGNFWVFTHGSEFFVNWSNTDSLQYFPYDSIWLNRKNAQVNKVYEGHGATLYLCTGAGLVSLKIDESKEKIDWNYWDRKSGLSGNNILCSVDDPLDPEQYIWLGTQKGINKLNKKTGECQHFSKYDGLPNNVVYGIVPDEFGYFWLSTNYGVSQFNPKTKFFRNFTAENDGLQNNEFNRAAFHKMKDGNIMFGGVSGISILKPKDFLPDSTFGNVMFIGLKINNEPIVFDNKNMILETPLWNTKEINLTHDQNFLEVDFASINKISSGKALFKYKMEGVDRDWVFGGERSTLSYPNLDPGEYELKIAEINSSGKLNPNYSSLVVHIASPWYASTLAYLVYAIAILSGLYFLFTFRLRQARVKQDLEFKQK